MALCISAEDVVDDLLWDADGHRILSFTARLMGYDGDEISRAVNDRIGDRIRRPKVIGCGKSAFA
jgi:hypothetical protein